RGSPGAWLPGARSAASPPCRGSSRARAGDATQYQHVSKRRLGPFCTERTRAKHVDGHEAEHRQADAGALEGGQALAQESNAIRPIDATVMLVRMPPAVALVIRNPYHRKPKTSRWPASDCTQRINQPLRPNAGSRRSTHQSAGTVDQTGEGEARRRCDKDR